MKLSESKAQSSWGIFKQISSIPRPSGHEERVSQWVRDFAKKHSLACRTDSAGNVIVEVAASPGHEKSPAVILQGHLDMVCQKSPASRHNFDKDPIQVIEKDGWVCADNTTLGADNGIGVAMALAAAIDKDAAHPAMELLFTLDEETGLTGANGLEEGVLRGGRLLNLDSEDDSLTVGCAGGEQTEIRLPSDWHVPEETYGCFSLRVSGLRGGHSGVNINEQRANAIKLIARCLAGLGRAFDLHIAEVRGGSAHNAIPRDAQATVFFGRSEFEKAAGIIKDFQEQFAGEYANVESGIRIELEKFTPQTAIAAMAADAGKKLVNLLLALPSGVNRFSGVYKGVVETSSNPAVITTEQEGKTICVNSSQRSLMESCLTAMTDTVEAAGRLAGATVKSSGRYPCWEPDMNSSLLAKCCEVYEKVNGRKPDIRVIHAGLECAVIGKKYPGMEMISFGPRIENAHSPQERLNIESVDKTWILLKKLLAAL